ncbi:hypothetical protein ACI2JA_20250 [Alkalihalobacillus sp. NPDC078783]
MGWEQEERQKNQDPRRLTKRNAINTKKKQGSHQEERADSKKCGADIKTEPLIPRRKNSTPRILKQTPRRMTTKPRTSTDIRKKMNIFHFSKNVWVITKKNGRKTKIPGALPRGTRKIPRKSRGPTKKRGPIARSAEQIPRPNPPHQEERNQHQGPWSKH